MLKLGCHCGGVRIELEEKPSYINACNCSLCAKSGAWWGYFEPASARVAGDTHRYRRADKDDPAVDVHFCPLCGSTTHFTLTERIIARLGNRHIGINMRLADMDDLAGVELRYPDGRNWPGTGEFGYVRAPIVIGR